MKGYRINRRCTKAEKKHNKRQFNHHFGDHYWRFREYHQNEIIRLKDYEIPRLKNNLKLLTKERDTYRYKLEHLVEVGERICYYTALAPPKIIDRHEGDPCLFRIPKIQRLTGYMDYNLEEFRTMDILEVRLCWLLAKIDSDPENFQTAIHFLVKGEKDNWGIKYVFSDLVIAAHRGVADTARQHILAEVNRKLGAIEI